MPEKHLHINGHETAVVIGNGLTARLDAFDNSRLVCLVDEQVYAHHTEKFRGRQCILIPQGEKHKSLAFAEEVMRRMIAIEADRTSFLVGIGGGLVTDLAGFVASTFMRGISFGFISTTLLGQVDASIGGKNGVNLDGFKNMIGVIRQPEFVWCDLSLLESLPQNELVSGFAEVIKYGAIRDSSLFEFIEHNHVKVHARDSVALERIVSDSAGIKIDIVSADVLEQGERKLLNFGHTLGHAIEKLSGRLHGEAIAIGMVLAARISVNLGFLQPASADRLETLISVAGLPVRTEIDHEELFNTLLKDKKRFGKDIHFILLREIGEAFIHKMQLDALRTVINDLY